MCTNDDSHAYLSAAPCLVEVQTDLRADRNACNAAMQSKCALCANDACGVLSGPVSHHL